MFPEKDPVFTVTYPDGWTVKVDSEANLNFEAGAGSSLSFIIEKLDAKTEEEAKVFLQQVVKMLDLGDAKTAKVSEIKETTTPKGAKLLAIYFNQHRRWREMSYSSTALGPKKGIYFAPLNVGAAAAARAHEKQ